MRVTSQSFANDAPIPGDFAFCVPADEGHATLAPNRNPHLAWSDAPNGTKSFAILCHDPDVPSKGDDVNQEGRTVPADLPCVDFFHWVLVDIAPTVDHIDAATHSDGVTPHGKKPGPAPVGVQGINDYTGWFAGDDAMKGDYGGYDGPAPPWNDSIVHHYHFTVFALDVESLGLAGSFTGQQARDAMKGHVLDQASWVGIYSMNPDVIAKMSP
jgi:Raf kinase inhibitor-like YbhB/YbcL family protein